MKGFASHSERNQNFTWVFRKGSNPFNTNLINVGLETHFYTDTTDTDLDRQITDAEETFSELIDDLRNCSFGAIENSLIPQFIAHLEVRTRHLRINFLQISGMLIDLMIEYLSKEDRFFEFAFKGIQDPTSFVHQDFIEMLEKNGESSKDILNGIEKDPEMLMILLKVLMPSRDSVEDFFKLTMPKEKLSESIKKGHISALKKSIAPPIRINFYDSFRYSVEEFPRGDLILGDSAVIFSVESGKKFQTFADINSEVDSILLPLTGSRILIGTRRDYFQISTNLPEIIAKNSMEYFISSTNDKPVQYFQKQIGTDASLITEKELTELIEDIFI